MVGKNDKLLPLAERGQLVLAGHKLASSPDVTAQRQVSGLGPKLITVDEVTSFFSAPPEPFPEEPEVS